MASPPGTLIHGSSRNRQFAPHETQHETQRRTTPKPLNFTQAMNDFGTMFPELDRNVIEIVLRANNGVVQSTIDQLLVLQDSTIQETKKSNADPGLPSYETSISMKDDEEPPPAYNDIWEDVPSPPPTQTNLPSYTNVAAVDSTDSGRFWNAPLVGKLPDDFLRLDMCRSNNNINKVNTINSRPPGQKSRSNTTEDFMTDEEIERFLADEKLALFLQNEEFLRELRRNQEFVTSLEADHRRAVSQSDNNATNVPAPLGATAASHGGARPRTTAQQPSQQNVQTHIQQDDVAFKHKLKHMGKSTRKKFGKIAKKFSRTRNSTRLPPILTHGGESTFNLLEEEVDDNDDEQNQQNQGYDGIQDDKSDIDDGDNEYDGDVETEEEKERQKRLRPTGRQLPQPGAGRQLPQPPGTHSSGTDEPIVFYGEDNEFEYKMD